jgi:hypothetical protein
MLERLALGWSGIGSLGGWSRSIGLGFLGQSRFRGEDPHFRGFDFLVFPWIRHNLGFSMGYTG